MTDVSGRKRQSKGKPTAGEFATEEKGEQTREGLLRSNPMTEDAVVEIAESSTMADWYGSDDYLDGGEVLRVYGDALDVLTEPEEYSNEDVEQAAVNAAVMVRAFRESQSDDIRLEDIKEELEYIDRFQTYQGIYEEIEELAEEGNLDPDTLESYFDYSAYGRDIQAETGVDESIEDLGFEHFHAADDKPKGYLRTAALVDDMKSEMMEINISGVTYYHNG